MEMKYCYVPVPKEQSFDEAVSLLRGLMAPCVIDVDNDFSNHCIHHIKVKGDNQSTWLMMMINKTFASDPRKFLRIRLNGGIESLTKQFVSKTLDAGGYVGSCSKEFVNSQGKRVFDIVDGEDCLTVSYGEVLDRLRAVIDNVDEAIFNDDSTSDLYSLFASSVGYRIERKNRDSGSTYKMFVEPQLVNTYQSVPRI